MSVRESFGPDAISNQTHAINIANPHTWAGGFMSFEQSPIVGAAAAGTDAAQLADFDDILDNYATLAGDNNMSTLDILFDEAPFLDAPLEVFTTPAELVTKARLDAVAASYSGVNENVTTLFTATNTFQGNTIKRQSTNVTTGFVKELVAIPFGTITALNRFQCSNVANVNGVMSLTAPVKISNPQGVMWAPGTAGNFITVTTANFDSSKTYTTPLWNTLPWTSTFFFTNSVAVTSQIIYFNGNGFDGQSTVLINACMPNTAIIVTSNVSTTRFVQAGSSAEATAFTISAGVAYQLFCSNLVSPTARALWTIVQVDQV
jgi:hypothetical protein